MLDFSVKKKKKKKNFDLDAALGKGPDDGELMDTSTSLDKENQEPSANNEDFEGIDEVASYQYFFSISYLNVLVVL